MPHKAGYEARADEATATRYFLKFTARLQTVAIDFKISSAISFKRSLDKIYALSDWSKILRHEQGKIIKDRLRAKFRTDKVKKF
nr:hypothetical protein [uncultured Campylobacter sp.]